MTALPVLYSFRRCPYAMRARWALWAANMAVVHREIVLRDKPAAMLQASPKGTVPVLVLPNGQVIDESLDVMRWALAQQDPQGWLAPERESLAAMLALIHACQSRFKPHLDRSKYPQRFGDEWRSLASTPAPEGANAGRADSAADADSTADAALPLFVAEQQAKAALFLQVLDTRLANAPALFGMRPALADFAIAPFVRQYASAHANWAAQPWPHLQRWLGALLARPEFEGR